MWTRIHTYSFPIFKNWVSSSSQHGWLGFLWNIKYAPPFSLDVRLAGKSSGQGPYTWPRGNWGLRRWMCGSAWPWLNLRIGRRIAQLAPWRTGEYFLNEQLLLQRIHKILGTTSTQGTFPPSVYSWGDHSPPAGGSSRGSLAVDAENRKDLMTANRFDICHYF